MYPNSAEDTDVTLWGWDGIQPSDAVQGYLGDCWFIAAAAAVAQDPQRIRNVFEIPVLNKSGIYAMNMFIMGVPITVVIDDKLGFW